MNPTVTRTLTTKNTITPHRQSSVPKTATRSRRTSKPNRVAPRHIAAADVSAATIRTTGYTGSSSEPAPGAVVHHPGELLAQPSRHGQPALGTERGGPPRVGGRREHLEVSGALEHRSRPPHVEGVRDEEQPAEPPRFQYPGDLDGLGPRVGGHGLHQDIRVGDAEAAREGGHHGRLGRAARLRGAAG